MQIQDNVSWRDYEGIDGFGMSSPDQLADLNKALSAGHEINPPSSPQAGDGFALRVESLEGTAKVVTYRADEVRLWKSLKKLPAYNTVEEYNRLESYGENEFGGFIAEGDLPQEDDSKYTRQFTLIKYLGTVRKVTHVMSLVRPAHGPVIGNEVVNGMVHLLKQVEKALFYGNSANVPVQWDGLFKLIEDGAPAANIIDLRGRPLSEDILNDAALTINSEPNHGRATDLHCANGAYSDLAKSFYPAERIPLGNGGLKDGMVGMAIKGFHSMQGPIMFNPNVFVSFGKAPSTTGIGDASKRPSTPTEAVAPTTPVDATAQFTANDAGSYRYKVVAVNRYGKSAPLTLTGPVAVTAGDKVTFGIGDGATPGTAYEVYRSPKDGAAGTEKLAFTVARSGATTTIDDTNAYLPGMSTAAMIQQNMEFFAFKQLAPFVKIPLATLDTSIRWMQLLYGALTVYAPGKGVIFRNVGRAAASVGGEGA